MPLYYIEKTSQKGQVLLVSSDKRGVCPIVSLQMPEVRAQQIIAALDLVATLDGQEEEKINLSLIKAAAWRISNMEIEIK